MTISGKGANQVAIDARRVGTLIGVSKCSSLVHDLATAAQVNTHKPLWR